jgi:hypothetical protein
MQLELLKTIISEGRIQWLKHSLERMMERSITRSDVKDVLLIGEIIEEYPEDKPFPSALFLGWVNDVPLHVVASVDSAGKFCFIITAYIPDLTHFDPNFKTRKK